MNYIGWGLCVFCCMCNVLLLVLVYGLLFVLLLYWVRNWFDMSLVNPLHTKRRLLYLKTQSVPRCKHFSSGL